MTRKQAIASVLLISAFPASHGYARRQLFLWLAVVSYVGGSFSAFPRQSYSAGRRADDEEAHEVEPRTNSRPRRAGWRRYEQRGLPVHYQSARLLLSLANLVVTKQRIQINVEV